MPPGALSSVVEPVGQVGDRVGEALRDRGEVPLVVVDEGGVGLGGELVGKVERTGRAGGQSINSVMVGGLDR